MSDRENWPALPGGMLPGVKAVVDWTIVPDRGKKVAKMPQKMNEQKPKDYRTGPKPRQFAPVVAQMDEVPAVERAVILPKTEVQPTERRVFNKFECLAESGSESDGESAYNGEVEELKAKAQECAARCDFKAAIGFLTTAAETCRRQGRNGEHAICLVEKSKCWFERGMIESDLGKRTNYRNNANNDADLAFKLDGDNVDALALLVRVAKLWKRRAIYAAVLHMLLDASRRLPAVKYLKLLISEVEGDIAKEFPSPSKTVPIEDFFRGCQSVKLLHDSGTFKAGSSAFVNGLVNKKTCNLFRLESGEINYEKVDLCFLERHFVSGDFVQVQSEKGTAYGRICGYNCEDGTYSVQLRGVIANYHTDDILLSPGRLSNEFFKHRVPGKPIVGDDVILYNSGDSFKIAYISNYEFYAFRGPTGLSIADSKQFWVPSLHEDELQASVEDPRGAAERPPRKRSKNTSHICEVEKKTAPGPLSDGACKKSLEVEIAAEEGRLRDIVGSFVDAEPAVVNSWVDSKTRFFLVGMLVTSSLCSVKAKLELIEDVVGKGADVNLQQCVSKDTSLHLAAASNSIELVRLLLSKGAIPSALNGKGQLPENCAVDGTVVDVLKKAREERKAMKAREKKSKKSKEKKLESALEPLLVEPLASPVESLPLEKALCSALIETKYISRVSLPELVAAAIASLASGASGLVRGPPHAASVALEASIGAEPEANSSDVTNAAVENIKVIDGVKTAELSLEGQVDQPAVQPLKAVKSNGVSFDRLSDEIDWNEDTLWEIEITKEARQQVELVIKYFYISLFIS